MRFRMSMPALLLAALLGSSQIACQRQENLHPTTQSGAPSGEKSVLPGGQEVVVPQQIPAPKRGLTAA